MKASVPNRMKAVVFAAVLLMTTSGCTREDRADAVAPDDGSGHKAQAVDAISAYASPEPVSGTIRLWGHGSFKHDFMRRLVTTWIDAFKRHHPQVEFEYLMYGTASAVGAVYTGAGDIAILGEEISPAAARAFVRAKGYPHTDVTIATGSLDVNYFDYAHMVFVHRDNPIERLSLKQLDTVFGAEHRRGDRNIRHWGELGLDGEWAHARIQPYGWKTDVDFALFFRERVLEDSHRWNPGIREFVHARHPDGTQYDHGQQILDALAGDPHGIAISNVRYARPEVKALALSWTDEGPWHAPTEATLISQEYPLVRLIPAIVDKPPDRELPAATREFLRFILSREGQKILIENSAYLPLSEVIAAQQREKLQ